MIEMEEQQTETYYVGTLAAYVLVDTYDQHDAEQKGEVQLREL